MFIVFEEENIKHPLYRIENYSKYISIRYSQKEVYQIFDFLNPNSMVNFAWIDYNKQRKLLVTSSFYP